MQTPRDISTAVVAGGIAAVIATLALCVCAVPLTAEAQPADKVARLGYLTVASRGPFHQEFEQALGERGWVTGKNLTIAYRFAEEKYLRGANPAELAVEQPSKFELVINLKTAKALGATIPSSLLAQAHQVIE